MMNLDTQNQAINNATASTASNKSLDSLLIPVSILSSGIIVIALLCLLTSGDDVSRTLQRLSGKFVFIDVTSSSVMSFIIILSVLSVLLWSLILVKAKKLFIVFLICSFALSEVRLTLVNEAAFGIRYLSIIVLISLGAAELIRNDRPAIGLVQLLGISFLCWCLLNLLINGFAPVSLAMLPVTFAIYLFIFSGRQRLLPDIIDVEWLCRAIGWIGVGMTIFHLCSFFLPEPFISGRFRSFYILPTNFANSYGLLLIGIIWLAIREKDIAIQSIAWFVLFVGAALIFLSGTRNSVLLLFVAAIIFSFVWRAKLISLFFAAIMVASIFFFILFQDSHAVTSLGERFTQLTSKNRFEVWNLAWQFIQERPLLGFGLGKGLDVLRTKQTSWAILNAHNAYLGIWLQTGLIGLVIILSLYFISLFRGLKLLLSRKVLRIKKETLSLPVALLLGLLIAGLFEENLTSRGSLHQIIWAFSIVTLDCATKIQN